ncbi:hypothetical protein Vdis_2489 [Vulcanisaeta distributa DSM 14429]|uniref:Uncharacterized protein n=1 Tax=Vulcanisaeta distributa (strain DSM 14429 / JCM 11212 / NBRC 100878 / IC-017) TaxID=572478 RepID=E1QRP0_VULDI|nr:hypothetical protein Vdis_2489 [Vulcanisaeta distributa DSM 14429]
MMNINKNNDIKINYFINVFIASNEVDVDVWT